MAKKMKILAAISVVCTLLACALYFLFYAPILLSLAITFGTVSYHFLMRLLVGGTVNAILHNRVSWEHPWFRQRAFEKKLYAFLKVRRWRDRLPTYDPAAFSVDAHDYSEIAQAMCQAEIVHLIILPLSFLPLLTVPFFGAFFVFLITSSLAAGYDLLFVILQRYQRPILLRVLQRRQRAGKESIYETDRNNT